jgi:hypothetical protein
VSTDALFGSNDIFGGTTFKHYNATVRETEVVNR